MKFIEPELYSRKYTLPELTLPELGHCSKRGIPSPLGKSPYLLQLDLQHILQLWHNRLKVLGKDRLGALFAEVHQSSTGMSLDTRSCKVIENDQKRRNDLKRAE